jgi:Jacalin-like lectin domain
MKTMFSRRSFSLALIASGVLRPGLVFGLATADDKPKPGKGSPSGEVYGGDGGESFRDRAQGILKGIKVRSGDLIDSIQCLWAEGGETNTGDLHGGEGGEEAEIKLEDGEYVTRISGVIVKLEDLKIVGSITIKTSKRTLGPYGQGTDGEKFEIEAPKDEEICGFRGRSGAYLDAIGIVTRPRTK